MKYFEFGFAKFFAQVAVFKFLLNFISFLQLTEEIFH